MKRSERYQLWKYRRAFATIRKIEERIAPTFDPNNFQLVSEDAPSAWKEAQELRLKFITETIARIREGFVANNVPKSERKRWLRQFISGDF